MHKAEGKVAGAAGQGEMLLELPATSAEPEGNQGGMEGGGIQAQAHGQGQKSWHGMAMAGSGSQPRPAMHPRTGMAGSNGLCCTCVQGHDEPLPYLSSAVTTPWFCLLNL